MASQSYGDSTFFSWDLSGGENDLDMPDSEKIISPPSSATVAEAVGRPRNSILGLTESLIPDLKGRSAEEVEREASKIRDRQYFSSFREFDRCMDSWGIMNGRTFSKHKTNDNFRVRLCRYGKTVRKNAKKTVQHDPTIKGDSESSPESSNESDSQHHGCKLTAGFNVNENLQLELEDQSAWPFTVESIFCEDSQQPHGKENASCSQIGSQINSQSRPVLGNLCTNTIAAQRSTLVPQNGLSGSAQSTLLSNKPRSYVQHTSEWIPHSFGRASGNGQEKGKKFSKTGACGQLA
ncbi:unnamed protein product [Calypogeia fissa]